MNKPESAFPDDLDRFCRGEHRRLWAALTLYCGDSFVAEEIAQETLVRTCLRWDRLQRHPNPHAWMYRVGINIANSLFRRRAAEHRANARSVGHATPQPSLEDVASALEVRKALQRLARRPRIAIVLRYYVGLNSRETGLAMRCSERTVRRLVGDALEILRRDATLNFLDKETVHAN